MFSADVECDTDSYTNMWPGPFGNLANSGEAERTRVDPRQGLSSTAPGRLQAMEDTQEVDSSTLFKVSRTWLRSLVTVLVNLSCMDILSLSLFLSPSFPHFLFSLVGAHVVSSTAGPPLLAGRDTEYLANYDDTEHSAGDSADCAEEDSNVLSQVFSPSTSFCLCFSCLAAICSAFFTYKIRPPMGRPTAALRLSYHCWRPGRLQ